MQMEFENAMLEALATPFDFEEDAGVSSNNKREAEHTPLALLPNIMPCATQPTTAEISFQVEAVTQKVNTMQIRKRSGTTDLQSLFAQKPASVLASPKPPRSSAPPRPEQPQFPPA